MTCPHCGAAMSSLTYTGNCPACCRPVAGIYIGTLAGEWVRGELTPALLRDERFVLVYSYEWLREGRAQCH